MKQQMTMPDLAREVKRQEESKADYLAQVTQLEMDGTPTLGGEVSLRVNGQGTFGVMPIAHDQIGQYVGIDARYYDRMLREQPQLLATNVNTWFGSMRDEKGNIPQRMVRTLDGKSRAFLSNSYRRRDNIDLMSQILPEVLHRRDITIASCAITERKLYLKFTVTSIEREVKVGDVVRAGMLIANSETGHGAIEVSPYSERLWCTNGAVHVEFGTRRAHIGKRIQSGDTGAMQLYSDETLAADDSAFWLMIRDQVRAVLTEETFDKIVDTMRSAADRKINHPEAAVNVLAARYALPEAERNAIFESLINSGSQLGYTQYALANAVTATANNTESYDRASEIEALGGGLFNLSPQDWKVIAEATPEDAPRKGRGRKAIAAA